MTMKQEYWNAFARAEYYTWAALRGLHSTGGDPVTGRPVEKMRFAYDSTFRDSSRAAYKAMARVWIARAAVIRKRLTEIGR